jgi:hypothetical protein
MMLSKIMDNPIGRIVVSVILGFGLATIFRKVCSGQNCVIVKGPSREEIAKYTYKIDEDCYKYTPYETSCEASATSGTIP